MKKRTFTLTTAVAALAVAAVIMASCKKDEGGLTGDMNRVTLNFSTKAMSDIATRSIATPAEDVVTSVAVFGFNAIGEVEQVFPVIENPSMSGNTLDVLSTVKSLRIIANHKEEHGLDYSSLSEIEREQIDHSNAPTAPFVMGGSISVNGTTLNVDLVRSIAKIEVLGANGFTVNSVTVLNTPSYGHVFAQSQIPAFNNADYVAYPEQSGTTVYVGENHKDIPTKLLVKGMYKSNVTAYTITLKQDDQNIHISRNTAYQVTVTPITDVECSVSVTLPEWDDVTADDNYFIDFGNYYTADFHNHTGFTDGQNPIDFVLNKALQYDLDVIVNSEHGGAGVGNASEGDFEGPVPTWIESGLSPMDILGTVSGAGVKQNMWRWQSIKEYSWPRIQAFNAINSANTLAVQGLEWNPPGHEHCSAGVIYGQFDGGDNADVMAQFEYMFDQNDADLIGGNAYGWVKSNKTGHEKSMEAAKWLQTNYRYSSWLVPAHPERANLWKIEDYRDMNDVAPDVFVAFESIPGHQSTQDRGGYRGQGGSYDGAYTFGGAGIQTAQIGNVWDAMLSEGRHFWIVANSDFHKHTLQGTGDFYPGEYQKTYISMKDKTAQSFVDGLRAGNIYTVHGDLIDRLEFSVGNATMGQTFKAKSSKVKVRILVGDPADANNNIYDSYTTPTLDHIDLIAGKMRSKVSKGSAEYSNGTYNDVEVIARFDANGGVIDENGITSTKWIDLGGGLKLVEYEVTISGDTYFRLRGTNHGLNAAGETDANGNPLEDVHSDTVMDGAVSAFADLWFYSNPIFVNL